MFPAYIQDNQKDKHCRWIILLHVLQEYTETWNASTNDWLCTSPTEAIKLQSVWSGALEAMQDLGSQEGHGWVHMRDGNFSYYCQSQTHQHQLAYLSWRRASARHLPASKTASVATQDLLTQKFASAWQTMKHVVTPMVWPASVTQKKTMKRVALRGTVK